MDTLNSLCIWSSNIGSVDINKVGSLAGVRLFWFEPSVSEYLFALNLPFDKLVFGEKFVIELPQTDPVYFFLLFLVVTGATDGIGKSYAEEVRVSLLIYLFAPQKAQWLITRQRFHSEAKRRRVTRRLLVEKDLLPHNSYSSFKSLLTPKLTSSFVFGFFITVKSNWSNPPLCKMWKHDCFQTGFPSDNTHVSLVKQTASPTPKHTPLFEPRLPAVHNSQTEIFWKCV